MIIDGPIMLRQTARMSVKNASVFKGHYTLLHGCLKLTHTS